MQLDNVIRNIHFKTTSAAEDKPKIHYQDGLFSLDEMYKLAGSRISEKNYEGAEELYNLILAHFPNHQAPAQFSPFGVHIYAVSQCENHLYRSK